MGLPKLLHGQTCQPGSRAVSGRRGSGTAGILLGDSLSRDYSAVAGSVILAAGLLLSLRVAPWYLGSQLQWVYVGLPWALGLLLAAQALSPLGGAAGTFSDVVRFGAVPMVLLLATGYLFPTILSFTKTALQGAWVLMTSGVVFLLVSVLVALSTSGGAGDKYAGAIGMLAFTAMAVGLFRLQQRLRALRPEQHPGVIPEATSDVERLGSAIQFVVESTMEQFVHVHGRRALHALEEQSTRAPGLEPAGPSPSMTGISPTPDSGPCWSALRDTPPRSPTSSPSRPAWPAIASWTGSSEASTA